MTAVQSQQVLQRRLATYELRRAGLALGIVGPPGIGKSYTSQRSVRDAGLAHMTVKATASNASLAKAWLQLPRPKNAPFPSWVQGLLEHLEAANSVQLEGLVQVCVTLMRAYAPFALIVEDAHEAIPSQLERFITLARALPKNTALIVTSRDDLADVFQTTVLKPLSHLDLTTLLENELGLALPGALVDWIFARSEGNPLFAVEYLRDLQRHGWLTMQGNQYHWRAPESGPIPNTIEALIEGIIDGLHSAASNASDSLTATEDHSSTDAGGQARAALEAWAMIRTGEAEFRDDALLAASAGLTLEQLHRAHDILERFGVLRGSAFTHGLFREITLKRLPVAQRRRIARRALAYLETSDPLAMVRFIAEAALPTERSFALYSAAIAAEPDALRAARLRAAALEFAPADQRFGIALQAANSLSTVDLLEGARLAEIARGIRPTDLEAVNLRARLWVSQGQSDRGKDLLMAIAPADPNQRSDEWWLKWCDLLLMTPDYAGAWEVYQSQSTVRAQLGVGSQVLLVRFLTMQAEYEQADAWLRRLEAQVDATLEERVKIISARGAFEGAHNRLQEVSLAIQNAYALVEHLPNTSLKCTALTNRANVFNWCGQYSKAHEDYTSTIQMLLEGGHVLQAATARIGMSNNLIDQGLYADAERGLLEARATLELCESWSYLTECEGCLVRLYSVWRPAHGAILVLKHAKAAVQHARTTRIRSSIVTALFWATMSETGFGNLERAQTLCAELHDLTQTDGQIYQWYWCQALILERQGNPAAALEALGAAVAARGAAEDAPDDDTDLMRLEILRIRGDPEGASSALAGFRARGFAPGETLCLHYFPLLQAPASVALASSGRLRLNALGGLQVIQNGVELPLRGAKRKLLLALLLEAQLSRRSEARTVELCAALYPNATDDEARASVKQLVFQVRAQLGADSVQTTASGYALYGARSDVQEFLEHGDVSLWRGPYLSDVEGMESQALEPIREALYRHLERRAEELIASEPAQAARLARILLEVEPFDACALALALRALQALGNYVSIGRMYKRSRETWLEVGEHLPDRWTDFLSAPRVA